MLAWWGLGVLLVVMGGVESSSVPIPQRVETLLAQMTLEEKVNQLASPRGSPSKDIKTYGKTSFGSRTSFLTTKERNAFQEHFVNGSRLHIPVIYYHESLHGGATGATVFPMPLTMGSTWNTTLVQTIYDAVGRDTRDFGAEIAFAPVINLWMDPRFGRHQEGFSPNPLLTAHYAVAAVAGLQGSATGNASEYLPTGRVIALGKHLAAYGGAVGGLNGAPAVVDERTMRDVYLKPWKAFAKAGGRGAMPSHQTVLGIPAHASRWLIHDVFRQEYGFGSGLTISDCSDINALMEFNVAADVSQAAARGLVAGVDNDLMCGTETYTTPNVKAALAAGQVTQGEVDDAVRHVLTAKFATGLFDHPYIPEVKPVDRHRSLALEAAEQGLVLLQNQDGLLPLKRSTKKVAVVGPLGNGTVEAREAFLGPYTSDGGMPVPSMVEALGQIVGAGEVSFSKGAEIDTSEPKLIPDAVALAQGSDLVVVVVGDSLRSCGEWGDRSSLDLAGSQLDLLNALVAAKLQAPIVVVLVHGRPATFGDVDLTKIGAILTAGRPGEEGATAIANVLFGITNPSGKLAVSWPRTVGHVGSGSSPWLQPIVGKWLANKRGFQDPDGRRYDNYNDDPLPPTPLFYFGHGLSYTTFSYSGLTANVSSGSTYPVVARFTVANTGNVVGSEVCQVYMKDPVGASLVARPWKRLVGFTRRTLEPGHSATVTIHIAADDIAQHDENMHFRITPGEYTLVVAGRSDVDTLHTTVKL